MIFYNVLNVLAMTINTVTLYWIKTKKQKEKKIKKRKTKYGKSSTDINLFLNSYYSMQKLMTFSVNWHLLL